MPPCAEFESLIDREHAGEALAAAERERLLDHLESCRSCDELFDLVRELRAAPATDDPSDAELAGMRQRVLRDLARPVVLPFGGRTERRRWLAATLAAAAALAGVAAGWTLATARRSGDAPAVAVLDVDSLAAELRRGAAVQASTGGADSPYQFRDVRVSNADGERVRLAFEVSRHLELELERQDPLLAEVLVQALAAPGSAGARLAAIDAAPSRLDAKVKQALLAAMHGDGNLAVRLRAQQRLAAVAGDEQIVEAMLDVLRADPSVEMRFAAIDYLAGNRVAAERLVAAIEDRSDDADRALWVHARDYLEGSSHATLSKGPQS